jgi:N-hydroxyarylamine O-acetyltransferase
VIDLEAYFRRIGILANAQGNLRADLNLLQQLTLAHTQAIAFENLNALMRIPIPLDIDSLEAKLVRSARGGYCYEQNALFAAVLEQLGFAVRRLAARVVWGSGSAQPWQNPRTHMVLLVSLADQHYLCDVGFGGNTPTAPLLLEMNREQQTPHETFRIVDHENVCNVQVKIGDAWLDAYLFDLQPQTNIDYEMANFYVATHPDSHFRHTLIAARPFEGGRYALRNRVLTTYRPDGEKQTRVLHDADELTKVLSANFGIEVPDATAFRTALGNIRDE